MGNSEKNKTPGQEVKAAQLTEIYTKIDKKGHRFGKECFQFFLIRQICSFHTEFQAYL
jgi:hypothetical protein